MKLGKVPCHPFMRFQNLLVELLLMHLATHLENPKIPKILIGQKMGKKWVILIHKTNANN